MIFRERRKLSAAELTLKFARLDREKRSEVRQIIPPEPPLVGGKLRRSSAGYTGPNRSKTVAPEKRAPEPNSDGSDQTV